MPAVPGKAVRFCPAALESWDGAASLETVLKSLPDSLLSHAIFPSICQAFRKVKSKGVQVWGPEAHCCLSALLSPTDCWPWPPGLPPLPSPPGLLPGSAITEGIFGPQILVSALSLPRDPAFHFQLQDLGLAGAHFTKRTTHPSFIALRVPPWPHSLYLSQNINPRPLG